MVTSQPGERDYLFRISVCPGNFPGNARVQVIGILLYTDREGLEDAVYTRDKTTKVQRGKRKVPLFALLMNSCAAVSTQWRTFDRLLCVFCNSYIGSLPVTHLSIHYFHVDYNAPCLPHKILHNHCFQFPISPGYYNRPKGNRTQWLYKILVNSFHFTEVSKGHRRRTLTAKCIKGKQQQNSEKRTGIFR